tara:strand:+ start:267 stop:479 length:213 start_codon:yes stop_codon:yes gene_type:complete
MTRNLIIIFISFLTFNLFPFNVFAYIGPGMSGGFIAATLGIIVAIFAALFGLIWFPAKRFFKKNKNRKKN